ncbi:Hypothetical protein R9X50_00001400 [Acrodontium crateriforme]|uniref:Methyltransferase domain-containing protein n=1 Tax=Acrodontium crateriforme TaxID=150365 RepID=A0AAQ3LX17_9PEZI|nr:Hypothetical protein R9X50_00001400 [Acrodontium crateriforme]
MAQPNHQYTLPRNAVESQRLNLQHELISAATTYVLHPRIEKGLPKEVRIADLGTGTGIWMQAVAKNSPASWQLTGFDMSDGQFPPADKRGRCAYEVLDALGTVPPKWQESFDVVHIRYLIAALTGDEWKKVASTAHKLLRSGGFIQWHEANFQAIRTVQNVPGASLRAERMLVKLFVEAHNRHGKLLQSDVHGLSQLLQSSGFENLEEDIISADRVAEHRLSVSQVGHKAMHFSLRQIVQQDPRIGLTVEQVDELARKGESEIENGDVYTSWDMHIVTGQKQ